MAEAKATISSGAAVQGSTLSPSFTMAQLLQDEPLHSPRAVWCLFSQPEHGTLNFPDEIHVHCDHARCGGVRRHSYESSKTYQNGDDFFAFATYKCTNCTDSQIVFGLKAEREDKSRAGTCTKIYQEPAFGEPIPKRLFQVIGETNREHFLQARRAIARGLGIGAYAYYRRIVENTKFDLIGSVLEIAQATNASSVQIELLKKAQAERQFSKAIEMLQDVSAIPAVLLIEGHNPLALLHDLLSDGIHELMDEECLERAREAEVILFAIANRMQIALAERKSEKAALTSIFKRKAAAGA